VSAGAGGIVIYRYNGEIDAIDEYSRRLVAELRTGGTDVRYFPGGIDDALQKCGGRPDWTLLQYNPFRFGRGGVAPRLLYQARRLRRTGAPLAVMVHEGWIDAVDPRSAAISRWQRMQLHQVLSWADAVMTSTQALARAIGRGAVHVPVGANVTPATSSRAAARSELGLNRRLVLTLFGRNNPSRALDYAEAAIQAIVDAYGADALTVLNLGADAPPLRTLSGLEVQSPGPLPERALSLRLWASDLVLLPFTDGLSTRRSTLMAALAHGRPVLGCSGANTERELADFVAMTPFGDPLAYAQEAVSLCSDAARRSSLGESGAELYRREFDWPVVATRTAAVVEEMRVRHARGITFVAHDVGGGGGMERHNEQLIGRLLDAGRPVTVLARSCHLASRPGLQFRRVPTPRRPFTLAYPAFFAVASLLLGRRHDATLHTTGAIVLNRADISTVHYCHRAAANHVDGSRASRPGVLYELNQRLGAWMSRVGESWCYQPRRMSLLAAVSRGVADEVCTAFPAMAESVEVIPNGVDTAVFRPDPAARARIRARLGLSDADQLMLFVGGDWQRKGLSFAVGALAAAPGWQLAVAGKGDQRPVRAQARAAGVQSRIHLLGRVAEMPALYSAADAFVFPTSYEAFPLVALEAAAAELPLLITRVNGAEELVEDGVNGWFIDRDSADIARRLQALTASGERARAMGVAARSATGRYSWDEMAERYLALYSQIASRHNGAKPAD
jgi:glycosyltransferase involved in cell wall biosynthesis